MVGGSSTRRRTVLPDLTCDPGVDAFLTKSTSRLRERTGADFTLGGWVDPRTRTVTIRCADGVQHNGILGATAAPAQNIGGKVVARGRHVIVERGGMTARAGANGPGWADCDDDV